jgi:predicted transcriptional regulator
VTDHSEPNGVAELTVKIVSAYVSNNTLAESELAELITTVASRLRQGSADPEQPAEERPEPAVSVRRSIRPDHLVCLVCGQRQKMLKRHLANRHDLIPSQYRERFGLKPDYPMAAPKYAQQRRELAPEWTGSAEETGRSGAKVARSGPAGGAEQTGDRIVRLAPWPLGCTCRASEFERGLLPGADHNRALQVARMP